jgi:hypothetical protein
MARKMSVDDLYGGRHFPHGRLRDGSHRRIESEPSLEPRRSGAFNSNVNQSPEDRHDNRSSPQGYDNDHPDDWIRGAGEDATGKPGFDHSPPRNKMRR